MQAISGASQSPHPRRTPACRSVTLKQSSKPGLSCNETSPQTSNEPSRLVNNGDSSGETSNAEHWFDQFNTRGPRHQPTLNDVEPPFFIGSHSSDSRRLESTPHNFDLPFRSTPALLASPNDSSDDYRDVIDDLTIENRSLKRRLHKYERRERTCPGKDRLFEVKVHDLPAGKKRELEDLLRNFAASLDQKPNDKRVGKEPLSTSDLSKYTSAVAGAKPSSSMASTRIADSGYGSMTASHQASTATSSRNPTRATEAQTSNSRNSSIRSYLHDIPEGLLPRQSPLMSHRQLQKLVVRRLEQIFGGRGAAPGIHQQSLQQQEVSQSAARADRSELEAHGGRAGEEGVREARIMDTETEDPMYPANIEAAVSDLPTMAAEDQLADGIAFHDFASASPFPSAEQRPTRPLDLDPDRAQVPADNLEYFRHLGFLGHGKNSAATASPDKDDYVYLNLLMNIAQLHTVNVTTEFVQTAMKEHSRNLELSADGRKVRWRGIEDRGSGSSSEAEPDFDITNSRVNGRKRLRARNRDWAAESQARKRVALSSPSEHNVPTHHAMVDHPSVDADSDSSGVGTLSELSLPLAGKETAESSALTSTAKLTDPGATQRDDGPIVFYKKAQFCIDLSGDAVKRLRRSNNIECGLVSTYPLGIEAPRKSTPSNKPAGHDRRTLSNLAKPPSAVEVEKASSLDITFPSHYSSPRRVTFAEPDDQILFEASGIGGVIPSDHFCYRVTTQRRVAREPSPHRARSKPTVSAPIATRLLGKSKPEHRITEQILSTHRTDMNPSPLPPATMHFSPTNSDANSGSEVNSDSSSSYDSGSRSSTSVYRHHNFDSLATLTRMQHSARTALQHPAALDHESDVLSSTSVEANRSSSEDGSDPDDAIDDDNQSLDFLATAREVDPDAIRAKEREYDAEMAERLAEEIPAGSSAATAGGGSGFASPEAMDLEDDEGSISS